MHANPVKRKLVEHPKDWPWSSWSFHAKGESGLVKIDPMDGDGGAEKRGKERPTLSKTKDERAGHPHKQNQNRFVEFRGCHPPDVIMVLHDRRHVWWVAPQR